MFTHGRLTEISTYSANQKTPTGLHAAGTYHGKGSSIAELKAAYPMVECLNEQPEGYALCQLKGNYKGRPIVTTFLFYNTQTGLQEIELDPGQQPS